MDNLTTVCFSGFSNEEKMRLAEIARQHGIKCLGSVSGKTDVLVGGPNCGPAKAAAARERGIPVLSIDEFFNKLGKEDRYHEHPPESACSYGDKLDIPRGNFLFLDFETANGSRSSICAMGCLFVSDGIIEKELFKLVQPPPGDFTNTRIHGISWKDVAEQPTFDEVWTTLFEELYPNAINYFVAHSAPADRSMLYAALQYYGYSIPGIPFLCTVRGSRKVFKNLSSHKLKDLCQHFSIPLSHHQALSDVKATARIFEVLISNGARIEDMLLDTPPQPRPSKKGFIKVEKVTEDLIGEISGNINYLVNLWDDKEISTDLLNEILSHVAESFGTYDE